MKRNKTSRLSRPYREELLSALKNDGEAAEYLRAAMEDDDPRVFLLALKNVIEAKEVKITDLAKSTGLNRENIYRVLSNRGNPNWLTIHKILSAIGFRLDVSQKIAS